MTETPESVEATAESLARVIGIRLRRLQGLFVAHWAAWFRRLGIAVTPVQGGILLLIDENPGLTQTALARLLRIEPPSLAQALGPLVRAGLVERTRTTHDGRAVALRLSPQGSETVAGVRRELRRQEEDVLSGMVPAERAALLRLLDRAIRSAEPALDRLAAEAAEAERQPAETGAGPSAGSGRPAP